MGTYLLFAVTGLTVLTASTGVRQLVDWTRSPARVSATVSACTASQVSDPETGTSTQYSCDFTWVWDGVEHRKNDGAEDLARTAVTGESRRALACRGPIGEDDAHDREDAAPGRGIPVLRT